MTLSPDKGSALCERAVEAARAGADVIRSYRDREVVVSIKDGGSTLASQVVTEVDRRCEAAIVEVLRAGPGILNEPPALLTEETEDDGQRLVRDCFWCVDPMDGTLAFTENIPGYCVSVALVARSGVPLVGVVLDPVTDHLYHAVRGGGAFRNGEQWTLPPAQQAVPSTVPLTLLADHSFLNHPDRERVMADLDAIAFELGLSGVTTGDYAGAVLNAIRVAEQAPACYFKFPKSEPGGGSLWDFAATACILTELGAVATNFAGAPLDLNRADSTFMNHRGALMASNQILAAKIRTIAPF